MNQQAFILIGRSGCGKGTQGKLLMEELKKKDPARPVLYIQTGNEFRTFIKGDSVTSKLSKEIYDQGGLQPEFLTIYMWTTLLVNNYKGNEHIVIDGTPRKYHEAGVLDSIFGFYKLIKPVVIYIEVSKEWATQKLLARGRFDDNAHEIEKRLGWFETDVVPTIEYYRKNPAYTFVQINGEGGIEEVWAELKRKLG